jgi:hypothetical protein
MGREKFDRNKVLSGFENVKQALEKVLASIDNIRAATVMLDAEPPPEVVQQMQEVAKLVSVITNGIKHYEKDPWVHLLFDVSSKASNASQLLWEAPLSDWMRQYPSVAKGVRDLREGLHDVNMMASAQIRTWQ